MTLIERDTLLAAAQWDSLVIRGDADLAVALEDFADEQGIALEYA